MQGINRDGVQLYEWNQWELGVIQVKWKVTNQVEGDYFLITPTLKTVYPASAAAN